MITLVTGPVSSGKTAYVTLKAMEAMARGETVGATYHLGGAERLPDSREAFRTDLDMVVIDSVEDIGYEYFTYRGRLFREWLIKAKQVGKPQIYLVTQYPKEFGFVNLTRRLIISKEGDLVTVYSEVETVDVSSTYGRYGVTV